MAVAKTTKSDLNAQLQNPLSESKLKKTSKDELQKMVDAQNTEVPEPAVTNVVDVEPNLPDFLKPENNTDEYHAQKNYEHEMKQRALHYAEALAKETGRGSGAFWIQDFEYKCTEIVVADDMDETGEVSKQIECILNHNDKVAYVVSEKGLIVGEDKNLYKTLNTPLEVTKPKGGGRKTSNGNTEISNFIIDSLSNEEQVYELKDLAQLMETKFGGTLSSYQTRLTDSKNPKYNKLPNGVLLVTQKIGNQKALLLDTDSRIDRSIVVTHKEHPWAKEEAQAEEELAVAA